MKKGINLITKQKKYLQYERFFRNLRIILVILATLLLVVITVSFLYLFSKNQQLERLMKEKKQILEFLSNNKQVEAEFIYFRNKQNRLISILNDDVNFLPYYNLITESLKSASPEPKLDTIIITKDRSINFTLTFDDSNSIILFLKFAESDEFLKSFSQLIISQFNIEFKKESKSYKLDLIGKLNPINENKN